MQRVENAFSRIPNGNFSHGTAHWTGRLSLDIAVVPGTAPGIPRYLLKAASEFWAEVPYRDLSQYPSVADLVQALVQPIAPGQFYVSVADKYAGAYIYGFQARPDGNWGTKAVVGDPVYMDDYRLGLFSGTYLIREVIDGNRAIVTRSAAALTVLDGNQAIGFYSRPAGDPNPVFRVDVDVDVRLAERPDGGTGVQLGDYFVSSTPPISGVITQITPDGKAFFVYSAAPHVPPASTGGAQVALGLDWQIIPYFTANIRRRLPACLYDLTLAYTLSNGAAVSPQNVWLELYDETGRLIGIKRPVVIGNSGMRYLFRAMPGTHLGLTFNRIVQRFMFESSEPHYGLAKIRFGNSNLSGTTYLGDAVLLKGDYTAYLAAPGGAGQTFDFIERQVCDESEIVPRGTVIAYAGGNACPSGYIRVEGLGDAGPDLDHLGSLYTPLGPFSMLGSSAHGVRYRDGSHEPRTYISYAVTTPRTDVCAGYTLEFRFGDHSVFALISSAGELKLSDPYGSSPTRYYEIELVGDFDGVISRATLVSGQMVVWKTGVVAAVQNAPDLAASEKDGGGFSLPGPAHRHNIGQSEDIAIAPDVGVPFRDRPNGNETGSIIFRRFYNHRHFQMRTASAVPEVRPVLLCQKL
jgi:hypothetical protein